MNFAKTSGGNIITLRNDHSTLKILPDLGAAVVSFNKDGGKNILKTDTSVWNHKFNKPVDKLLMNELLPIYGHTVWLGPQSRWWSVQNEYPDLKNKNVHWPPDPYWIYGKYEILKRTKDEAILISPVSKFTGMRFVKKIRISDEGKALFEVEAENCRKENFKWDLWLNTRLDGYSRVFVPVTSEKNVRVKYRDNVHFDKMPFKVEEGFFRFETRKPSRGKEKIDGKAFIYPAYGKMFAFADSQMFVIHFKLFLVSGIHPEQGLVEIYNSVSKDGNALAELEYHTPYQTIRPGGKIKSSEEWEIINYRNGDSVEEQIEFINYYNKLNER